MTSTVFSQASSEAWQCEAYGYHSPCFARYLSRDGLRCLWASTRRALRAVRYAADDWAGPRAAVAERAGALSAPLGQPLRCAAGRRDQPSHAAAVASCPPLVPPPPDLPLPCHPLPPLRCPHHPPS